MKTQFKKLLLTAPLVLAFNFAAANPWNCANFWGEFEMTPVPGTSLMVAECYGTLITLDKEKRVVIVGNAQEVTWELPQESQTDKDIREWLGVTTTVIDFHNIAIDFSKANIDRLKSLQQVNTSALPPNEREAILFTLVKSAQQNQEK